MKYYSCSLLALFLLTMLVAAQGKRNWDKVMLIEAGDGFHGNEIHARSGEKWLGLFVEKGRSFLAYTTVRVLRINDPVVDEEPKQKTGKAVIIDRKAKSYFLLRGITVLKPATSQLFLQVENTWRTVIHFRCVLARKNTTSKLSRNEPTIRDPLQVMPNWYSRRGKPIKPCFLSRNRPKRIRMMPGNYSGLGIWIKMETRLVYQ